MPPDLSHQQATAQELLSGDGAEDVEAGGPSAGRDRGHLVDSLDRQVAAVRSALARNGRGDVPVQGAFCFTKAELPLFGSSEIRGHRLCSERSLGRRLNANGALGREAIDALARSLASSFPPA